jgi:acetylornithine deacetylase
MDDEVAALTADLVSIPSHEDETAAGDAIEAWLREETDADVERDAVGNVLARKGDPKGETLALVGHHDVVPPDASQVEDDGYVVEERDGRIYGRGSADMKGAVAAAMLAFRDSESPQTARADGGSPRDSGPAGELVFASFVGEEVGGTGARHAIERGFAPDYALVAEGSTNYSGPGVTDVVVAHKGRRASVLVAHGEASHASEPDAGVNAVYRACDAVDVVRELAPPEAEVFGHEVQGSVVVTEIDGGTAWNVVPERCEVTVDERTVPGDRAELARAEINGVEWLVEQDLPPMACSDDAFADAALASARRAQKGDPQHVVKPHATDAGWLAEAGTACVVCGASEPGEAHTRTESVSVEVLARCYRIYRDLAETFPA